MSKYPHILIAEDDIDDRFMLKEAFEETGTLQTLSFVEDGMELMDYLLKRGKHLDRKNRLPGLILLDLNMPKKDGREAISEIKNNPEFCHIPIVIFTTSKSQEDMQQAYMLGASCFIVKPVSFEGLLEIIRTFKKFWFEVASLPVI